MNVQQWAQSHKQVLVAGGAGAAVLVGLYARSHAGGGGSAGPTTATTTGAPGAIGDTTATDLVDYVDKNNAAQDSNLKAQLGVISGKLGWLATQRGHLSDVVTQQRSQIGLLQKQVAALTPKKKATVKAPAKSPLAASITKAAAKK